MRTFAVGLLIGVALAAGVASAQESGSSLLTGRDFRGLSLLARTTWVNGWMAGFAMIAWSGAPVVAACLAKRKPTVGELRSRLDEYIASHAEEAGKPVPILLVDAMETTCR